MSQSIWKELDFLLHIFLMGIIIKHGNIWIALEDMGFWMICSIGIFGLLMEENNGTLRWFAVLGSLLGMIVYKATISGLYVKYTTLVIQWTLRKAMQALYLLLRPICFLLKKLYRLFRRMYRWTRRNARIVKLV